jgi:hypothetical protein
MIPMVKISQTKKPELSILSVSWNILRQKYVLFKKNGLYFGRPLYLKISAEILFTNKIINIMW